MFVLLLLLPAATALLFWKAELRGWLLDLAGVETNPAQFAANCLHQLNDRRQRVGSDPLTFDVDLQSTLEGFVASVPNGSDIDLDFLLQHLQRSFPDVTSLSATVVWHPSLNGLAKGVAEWDDGVSRQFDLLGTVSFRDRYRHGCVAVLAHRLPIFDLEAANRDGGRYHQTCPRCGAGHAIELDKTARTVQLRCPHCQRPYAILASDSLGRFHRAPSFLTGFSLPENEPALHPDSERAEDHVRALWKLVTQRCRYQSDEIADDNSEPYEDEVLTAGLGGTDSASDIENSIPEIALPAAARRTAQAEARLEAWQIPAETWHRKAGDCEDTSLLLADLLIGAGFDARVALGWNAQGGDHAWCVVRLGGESGEQYILETTIDPGNRPLRLLPVSEASAAYRPEQLFDREHLYFVVGGSPAKDYWSDNIWASVEELRARNDTARNE